MKNKNKFENLPFQLNEVFEGMIEQHKRNPKFIETLPPVEKLKFFRYVEHKNSLQARSQK